MELLANLLNFKGVLLIILVFVPLQKILPMHADQKIFRRGWLNDLIYVFLNAILIRIGLTLMVALIAVTGDAFVPQGFRQWVAGQPYWVQAIELIVLSDLGFYGVHRLFHSVPFLWRFHAIHHSIEEMDWLAAHRVHPIDQILTKGVSLVPCFAFGFSEWAIATFAVLYHWHSLLLHANVRLRLGPLRWLVASPEFHHWHHSNQREARDKNFAAQLSLWDVVFGSVHMPRGELPSCYGVNDPVPPTYVPQLIYPFRRNGTEASPDVGEIDPSRDEAVEKEHLPRSA